MEKKRKLDSESSKLPQQIEEEEEQIVSEEEDADEFEEEEYEEVVEYEEYEEGEDEEECEEEEEEVEEIVEEPDVKKEEQPDEKVVQDANSKDADDEPIQSVISAFSKESLMTLLSEAAALHPDVAARVRATAELDPSQRKIFVHGLNWETTSEILVEEFRKYGEIEDCRLITDKSTGRSKGYGFILFKTSREARQALKEPQKMINNRLTSCQLASLGHAAAPLAQKQQQTSEHTQRKIYVSNVGAGLDPVKLKDFFSKYGEIEEGPLGLDRETGKPKGFCLFVYKTVDSAKSALMEPHKHFDGVTLYCQQANDGPKSQKTRVEKEKNQEYGGNVGPGIIASPQMPAFQAPPIMHHPQQPLNVDPTALGQALTAIMAAQGAGLNLLGALGGGTGPVQYPGVVPGFGNEVVQGGYGNGGVGHFGGTNMGSGGRGGYMNQGRNPTRQRRGRGAGRSK